MIEKCPECAERILLMPVREPLPESTGNMTMTLNATQQISWPYQPSYSPTMHIYKCSNPKCWVTKITESWE